MIRRCRRTECLHRSKNEKHEGRCKYDGQYIKINEIHDGQCRYEGQYQDDEIHDGQCRYEGQYQDDE